jgi:mannan endo-1,6-alpha-mannosidase
MTCTTDMLSFKGYVHRWMSTVTQIAPSVAAKVLPVLKISATAAVNQCTGGSNGRTCGFSWVKETYDGTFGAGQEMNVLAAVSSLLIGDAKVPVTNATGGTSVGNINAGQNSDSFIDTVTPVTVGDRAGASILTILVLVSAIGTFGWMSTGS